MARSSELNKKRQVMWISIQCFRWVGKSEDVPAKKGGSAFSYNDKFKLKLWWVRKVWVGWLTLVLGSASL